MIKEYKNISYKKLAAHDLYLDIFVPDEKNPPLVMWVHGGGWKELNRTWNLAMPMLEKGYAVATVDYRYCDEEKFPAQMMDLKTALLFLRNHAAEYGYDGGKIAVSGDSAGAHLGTLLGVSAGNKEWEGIEGDYSVQAVVDMCGPTDLTMTFQGKEGELDEASVEFLGVAGNCKEDLACAAKASPVNYISGKEPPFLILHGSEDPIMSPKHSILLRNVLEKAGVPVMMYLVPGALHAFGGKLVTDIISEFLDYYLKGSKTVETPEVKKCHCRELPYV